MQPNNHFSRSSPDFGQVDRRKTPSVAGHPLRRETDWPTITPVIDVDVASSWKQVYTTNSLDFARLVANAVLEASAAQLTTANRRAFIAVTVVETLGEAHAIASAAMAIASLGECLECKTAEWTTRVLPSYGTSPVPLILFHFGGSVNPMRWRWLFQDVFNSGPFDARLGGYVVPLVSA